MSEPLGKERPTTIQNLEKSEEGESESENSESNIYEDEELEERIYNYSYKVPTCITSRKLVSPFISAPGEFSPMIFLEGDSEELDDSSFEWYSYTWNDKVPEYKFEENDSMLNVVLT